MPRYTMMVEANQWQPGLLLHGVYGEETPEGPRYYIRDRGDQKVYLKPGDFVVEDLTDWSLSVVPAVEFHRRFAAVESFAERD